MVDFVQYAIIRFRPFPETGEFANVGILLFERQRASLRYKVVPRRFRRVSQFFNLTNPDFFWNAVTLLQEELNRLSGVIRKQGASGAFFEQFLQRGRESIWVFSNLRTVVAQGDESEDVLDQLYSRYVGRNFANVEYQEQVMVRGIRHSLKRREIYGYAERTVDDELVPMKFPLVSEANGLHVIKPISLNRKTTLGIIDHAATWHDRFKLLIGRGRLQRDGVLIPIAAPDRSDPLINEAFETASNELRELGVQVIDQDDAEALLNFARKGAERKPKDLYH